MNTGRIVSVVFTDELHEWALSMVEDGHAGLARELVRKLFTIEERMTSNCRGLVKKKRLDVLRFNAIKEEVFSILPCASADRNKLWNICIKSIDAMNRDLARRTN